MFVAPLTHSQLFIAMIAVGAASCLLFHIGREIYYAANPDKRVVKWKRRK